MERVYLPAIGAAVTLVIGALLKWAGRYIRNRVRFSGPEGRRLHAMEENLKSQARLTTILLRVQRPQLTALIALLEATKGNINGNIDAALSAMKQAREDFDCYLVGEATVNECLEADKD